MESFFSAMSPRRRHLVLLVIIIVAWAISTRNKFVKLRNRLFGNPNYVSNPAYYIKPAELNNVTVLGGTVILGHVPIDMKPAKFQPLDY